MEGKSAWPMQSTVRERKLGLVLEVENLLILWPVLS